MTRVALTLLACCITLVGVGAAAWFGRSIPFAAQWPLYEALRTTAAIIFAVVGAWLAIVYPDRLRLLGNGNGNAKVAGERFSQLFAPVVNSSVILCIVLLVGIIAPVLRQLAWLQAHIEVVRALSFTVLVCLTLWQVWTVILTLVPADMLKRKADQEASLIAYTDALRGLGAQLPRTDTEHKD